MASSLTRFLAAVTGGCPFGPRTEAAGSFYASEGQTFLRQTGGTKQAGVHASPPVSPLRTEVIFVIHSFKQTELRVGCQALLGRVVRGIRDQHGPAPIPSTWENVCPTAGG